MALENEGNMPMIQSDFILSVLVSRAILSIFTQKVLFVHYYAQNIAYSPGKSELTPK